MLPILLTSAFLGVVCLVSLRLWGGYIDILRCRMGRPRPTTGAHASDDGTAEWRALQGHAKLNFYGATIAMLLFFGSLGVLAVRQ